MQPCTAGAQKPHGEPENGIDEKQPEASFHGTICVNPGGDEAAAGSCESGDAAGGNGDAQAVIVDKPLLPHHLRTVQRVDTQPCGNRAFWAFVDERCRTTGNLPITEFYARFVSYCIENHINIPNRKGMRYLLHRNLFEIKQVRVGGYENDKRIVVKGLSYVG